MEEFADESNSVLENLLFRRVEPAREGIGNPFEIPMTIDLLYS